MDSYTIEFLDLSKSFKEFDLRKGLIQNMKDRGLKCLIAFKFMPANIETKSNANAKPPVMRVVGEILESLFRRKEIDI